ncbi:cAMP-dependent protein kinase type II regulatory subunit-like isoform X2 [Mizuhopecten yessoensis]|uniref:cAMP-dependent protein kinase type II regulatory subunit-like isoform X2 n=1 Tax=Mizuhopecten yessoensis TaxID=6573 RepID=UPI000B4590DA|nr:cAMP-dependent protein kinase type II regulatory subunit-like isoform X2 [Mizuhopecten yessoensis]XP_021358819.1 cAMP-dependent protein kinase type II regulatory subunit-like isoform X2 [Mizuhopecten yessoensis]
MNFEIPPGLTDLLQDFTVSVLKERPPDLVQFAANYFVKLNSKKNIDRDDEDDSGERGVRFAGASPPPGEPMDEDDDYDDDDDDEPMEPPTNRFQRRQSVSAERYDPEADSDEGEDKIVYPKSDGQRKRLSEAVHHILLFRSLDVEQMQEVLDAMFEKKVKPAEHVIDQGDDGDNFYVIDSGTYDIFVNGNLVGKYDSKGSFGELALMYNMPRAATIVATSDGTLWAMDRTTFRRIVLKNAFNKRKMYEALLEHVPMLKTLEPYERMNVADALLSRSFTDGEVIIKQGDEADCMYFIEEGNVRVTVKNKSEPSSEELEVKRYEKGGYFGELALVTHKPRAATAYSIGSTKCAVLDVQAFERLLGPCMDLMKRSIDQYEEQLVQIESQHF